MHTGRAKCKVQPGRAEARNRAFAECMESFRLDRKYCTDHYSSNAYPPDKHMGMPCLEGANRSFTNCIDAIE